MTDRLSPDELYTALNTIVENTDMFFKAEHQLDGDTYEIFNYRLANYTGFLLPGALECRGIMFRITGDTPVLVSRPMLKFFNVNENPTTMNLDLQNPMQIMDKADGSLISTFTRGGDRPRLGIKSKGSLHSEQALAAYKYLTHDKQSRFAAQLLTADIAGWTVNMEWCAPNNRIVLGYLEPQLIVLNIRNRETGEYWSLEQVKEAGWNYIADRWVDMIDWRDLASSPEELMERSDEMTGIEGFVWQLANQQHVKKKTEWYLVQHRAKDSVNSPRRLFEAVLEEASDDLKTLFIDDPVSLIKISEMETRVESIYNPLVAKVEAYYNTNKELDRKSYAVKGINTFTNKGEFGLVMNLYLGKPCDIKTFLRKHYKEYGITDDAPIDELTTGE